MIIPQTAQPLVNTHLPSGADETAPHLPSGARPFALKGTSICPQGQVHLPSGANAIKVPITLLRERESTLPALDSQNQADASPTKASLPSLYPASSQPILPKPQLAPQVLIDIETTGTTPGCAVLTIGAVQFDPTTLTITRRFYVALDLRQSIAAGFTVDPDTIAWWQKQNVPAFNAAFLPDDYLSPLEALQRLAKWMPEESWVWGNSPSFDCSILAAYYESFSVPLPWSDFRERCYRTMRECHPIPQAPFIGTKHHALHDAQHEATHLMRILTSTWTPTFPTHHLN